MSSGLTSSRSVHSKEGVSALPEVAAWCVATTQPGGNDPDEAAAVAVAAAERWLATANASPSSSTSAGRARRAGGRPAGSQTIRPPVLKDGAVLLGQANLIMQTVYQALAVGGREAPNGWTVDQTRLPRLTRQTDHLTASIVMMAHDAQLGNPDERRRSGNGVAACPIALLGAAEMQLLLYLDNAWLTMNAPEDEVLVSAAGYAEARGLDRHQASKHSVDERRRFSAVVRRLAALDIQAEVVKKKDNGKVERYRADGPILKAEPEFELMAGTRRSGSGIKQPDVSAWRLKPGAAWRASRSLNQLARYPTQLLSSNPHKHVLLIRLGQYLGYQTAVRASKGTLGQPLSVRAILDGIGEAIPIDRRLFGKLKTRFEDALDTLQEEGVLRSWEWGREGGAGPEGFLSSTIRFLYHQASLDEHAAHHKRAKKPLNSPEVRRLLPKPARNTHPGGDENPVRW